MRNLLLSTDMRISKVDNLKWKDVNLVKDSIP